MHLRAALYARVSTEDQAVEGFSLEAQMKKLEAYCRSNGWEIAGRYVDDGYSGRKTNRPEYQRMLSDMDSWDVLLVLKMDRIHRNSVNFTQMIDHLRKNNKDFASVYDQFDTGNAMGRFVMDTIQRIAQLESEQIGERVKLAMTYKAKNDTGNLGSGHPYGYEYRDGRLEVVTEEAEVVRMIFDLYIDNRSLRAVCDELNESGIKSKKGGDWSKPAVSKILHNPLYIGYGRWDGIIRKGNQDPIVTVKKFRAVNKDFVVP